MNNAKISVEIQTPQGERIVFQHEISNKEFHMFLKAVHKNKHPFVDDNIAEIEQIQQVRQNFTQMLSEKIGDSFLKYFDSIDTVNGYTKDKL